MLGSNLDSRIENGIIKDKVNTSILEANSVIQYVTYRLTIGTLTTPSELSVIAEDIVNSPEIGAQNFGREILLINVDGQVINGVPATLVTRGFDQQSISKVLRERVRSSIQTQSERGMLRYLDGRSTSGVLIGKRITVPRLATYEIYLAYGFQDQLETIDLIRGAIVFSGALFVILILFFSLLVLRRVIRPVQEAAEIAEKLTSGDLQIRMDVKGEDELARLGIAFNDMASTLSTQIARLENLSRVQQRFVSDVSHELRTPLTTIRMAADVIYSSKNSFDPTITRSAELLLSQIERFEALLEDLLEVSRFDAKVVTSSMTKVDIVAIVNRLVDELATFAIEKKTNIQINFQENSIIIDGDSLRLERILRNLLTNAIDHSESKPIDVVIAASDTDVSVGVRDHGIGLTSHQISRVFDRFWRADPSRSRVRGGTGLGLSIAKEDAALHGGEIQVWGELGQGSNFVLTLPRSHGRELQSRPISAIPTKI